MNKVRIVKNILVVVGVLEMGFSGFAGAADWNPPVEPNKIQSTTPSAKIP
ncbi:hypothetical protein [Deinococcus misasensis]|nr:hypothetical protein [Deinococcus misasensis]